MANEFNCKFCGKECKNKNSLAQHEIRCKDNPDKISVYTEGFNSFRTLAANYNVNLKSSGSDVKTNIQTNQCYYCEKWFEPTKIGGHVGWCKRTAQGKTKKPGDRKYVLVGGDRLDVSYDYIENYRKLHTVCEICGKTVEESVKYTGKFATKNLCVDHDHKTLKFRGLLCQVCNRQLGWYEANMDSIIKYLNKSNT